MRKLFCRGLDHQSGRYFGPMGLGENQMIAALASGIAKETFESLRSSDVLADAEVVHALRVGTKRLRAAWHLVERLLPAGVAKKRRRALSALSALVSAQRDRDVLEALAAELAGRFSKDAEAAALANLAEALAAQGAGEAFRLGETAGRILEGLKIEIQAWESVGHLTGKAQRGELNDAVERSCGRAREAAVRALEETDPEVWHDWRKAVKRLRYQREILAATEGRAASVDEQRVCELGTMLGRCNDLANLARAVPELAAEGPKPEKSRALALAAVQREGKALMERCRALGEEMLFRHTGRIKT